MLNLNKNKVILFFVLTLITAIQASAQKFVESGINIGVNAGGSKLISEFSGNFKSINEFTNKPGLASGIEISKILFPHYELGVELNYTKLNGNTDKTDHFSAIGYHAAFMEPLTGPTEYKNKLTGQQFFLRYYIYDALNKTSFNPFIKIGFGYLTYKSIFMYSDTQIVIFGKGNENQTNLSTGMVVLGTGFKTSLTDQIYLITSIDFNAVKYDFLDVVHNYDINGNRANITGLYSEIKIGIFFNSKHLNNSGQSGKRKKGKSAAKFDNLPFAR